MTPKFIQITATDDGNLFALDEVGDVWRAAGKSRPRGWYKVPMARQGDDTP